MDIKSKENLKNKHIFRYTYGIGQILKISSEFSSNQSSSNVVQTNSQNVGKAQKKSEQAQL